LTDQGPRLETLLRAIPFLARLDRVDLARLVGALEAERYAQNDVIFQEGGSGDALYLAERGRVRVSVLAAAGERTITLHGRG
jgi:CRP-like cAMP-binding protein